MLQFFFSFYKFSNPPLVIGVFLLYITLFASSPPSTCRSSSWFLSFSHQYLPEVFENSCKAQYHCLGITSTLMWPESCRVFNAVVAVFFQIFLSFLLSYSLLMFILTSRIVWSVDLDGKPNLLTSALLGQGGISPRTTLLNFYGQNPSITHRLVPFV